MHSKMRLGVALAINLLTIKEKLIQAKKQCGFVDSICKPQLIPRRGKRCKGSGANCPSLKLGNPQSYDKTSII